MAHVVDIDALSPQERLQLIGELWDGLTSQSEDIPVAPELLDELERRRAAYERDPATASLWSDVRRRILQRE